MKLPQFFIEHSSVPRFFGHTFVTIAFWTFVPKTKEEVPETSLKHEYYHVLDWFRWTALSLLVVGVFSASVDLPWWTTILGFLVYPAVYHYWQIRVGYNENPFEEAARKYAGQPLRSKRRVP